MSYLDKYTILESFHKNTLQNIQMGYIKSDPNHIVVINVMNASDIFHPVDFQQYITAFTSLVESEINDDHCILITDYHEGHPLEKFLDNFQPPLNLRLKIAHQFFDLLRSYHALPLLILDKLMDPKHLIVKDNQLTHNELLMYEANYERPEAFNSLSIKIGRILTLMVPDVSDRHAQSFYTIIDDLLHGSRFSSLDSLLQTYDQIAGRYKKEMQSQPPVATPSQDVWKAFDTPVAEIAALATGAAVLGHSASFAETFKNPSNLTEPAPQAIHTEYADSYEDTVIEGSTINQTPPDLEIQTVPETTINPSPLSNMAPDTEVDANTESEVESDVESDVESEVESEVESDVESEVESEGTPESAPLADTETVTDTDTVTDSIPVPVMVPDTDTDTDTDPVPVPDTVTDTDPNTDSNAVDPLLIPLAMPVLEPLAKREYPLEEEPEFDKPEDFAQISDFWDTPVEPSAPIVTTSEPQDSITSADDPIVDDLLVTDALSDDPALDTDDDDPFKAIHLQIDDRIKLEENRKKKMWMVLLPILLLLLVIIGLVLAKPFSFKSYDNPKAQFTQTKAGTTWHFTSTSTSDPNLSIKSFHWTLSKEGVTLLTKTEKDITYTFTEKGTYDISLKVMDSKLKWSDPFKVSVVIDSTTLPDTTEATSEATTEAVTESGTASGDVTQPGVEEDTTTARSGSKSYKVTLYDAAPPQITLSQMNFEGNGVLALWVKTAEQGKITLDVTGTKNDTTQFTTRLETDNYPINQWFLMTQNIETKAMDSLLITVSGTAKVLWLDDITLETIK